MSMYCDSEVIQGHNVSLASSSDGKECAFIHNSRKSKNCGGTESESEEEGKGCQEGTKTSLMLCQAWRLSPRRVPTFVGRTILKEDAK